MPDFFTVVKGRRAVRKFKKKEIPLKTLEKIIEAGTWAPSAVNTQPWEFVLVRDAEKKKKFGAIYEESMKAFYRQDTEFIENATLLLVLADKEKALHLLSTSAAIENILLAATAMGLGSVWMCRPLMVEKNLNELRELFGIPQKYEIVGVIALGYPDEKPKPKERRSLKEILHYEKF
ncbi:MAG: nitroreductase family protein [Candidatus Micrarchaeota archaeon]|nr:nitroreductase family protein [Candidatus Micrarchaeota archaeon]